MKTKPKKTMNTEIITTKSGRVWEWAAIRDGQHIAGGYCRTKADALNDAQCWIRGTK